MYRRLNTEAEYISPIETSTHNLIHRLMRRLSTAGDKDT